MQALNSTTNIIQINLRNVRLSVMISGWKEHLDTHLVYMYHKAICNVQYAQIYAQIHF